MRSFINKICLLIGTIGFFFPAYAQRTNSLLVGNGRDGLQKELGLTVGAEIAFGAVLLNVNSLPSDKGYSGGYSTELKNGGTTSQSLLVSNRFGLFSGLEWQSLRFTYNVTYNSTYPSQSASVGFTISSFQIPLIFRYVPSRPDKFGVASNVDAKFCFQSSNLKDATKITDIVSKFNPAIFAGIYVYIPVIHKLCIHAGSVYQMHVSFAGMNEYQITNIIDIVGKTAFITTYNV